MLRVIMGWNEEKITMQLGMGQEINASDAAGKYKEMQLESHGMGA